LPRNGLLDIKLKYWRAEGSLLPRFEVGSNQVQAPNKRKPFMVQRQRGKVLPPTELYAKTWE
jgi:hypothetical protein